MKHLFDCGTITYNFDTFEIIGISENFVLMSGFSKERIIEKHNKFINKIDENGVNAAAVREKIEFFREYSPCCHNVFINHGETNEPLVFQVSSNPIIDGNMEKRVINCVFINKTKFFYSDVLVLNSPCAILAVKFSQKMEITYANNFFLSLLNLTRDEISEKYKNSFAEIISSYEADKIFLAIDNSRRTSAVLSEKFKFIGKDGDVRQFSVNISYSKDEDFAMLSCYEITEYVERVANVANTDVLTSAPSYLKFEKNAEEIIKAERNCESVYSITYFGLRKLKMINEVYGSSMGNFVLKSLADAIKTEMVSEECFGRIFANNFVVLRIVRDEKDVVEETVSWLNLIREKLIALVPTIINSNVVNFYSGICLVDSELRISAMVDHANTARKSAVGNSITPVSCAIFDEEMARKEKIQTLIEQTMDKALENREFKVYLQPKFSLKTRTISGAEALVRWIHDDGRITYPSDFIPLFEQNGFVTKVDFYVYEETFRYMKELISNAKIPVPISVNVSRAHLSDDDFVDKFHGLTKKYEISENLVEIEITESMMFDNESRLLEITNDLRELNYRISVDDFGSGYSSLGLLRGLNADVLKLDKSLIDSKLTNNTRLLLKNVVILAKDLNMEIVCEGVETKEQVNFLTEIGCDYVQGYFFAKPMPISEFNDKYYGG